MSKLLSIPGAIGFGISDIQDYLIRLYVRASWRRQGVHLFRGASLHYERREQIKILGECSIGMYSIVLVTGQDSTLTVGARTYIGDQTNIRTAGGAIRIGNDVLIANHVTIVGSNHGMKLGKPMAGQEWTPADVLIEDDVWIGAGVVVLPGATIRQGAVIAAGAVVRGEIEANTINGGIPARQIALRV